MPPVPPNHRPGLDAITHNVIIRHEVNGPGDDTAVSWLLVTTLPIETIAEILLAVDYYAARWTIETYIPTFNVGCQVEKIMLETRSRLPNCLAMSHIISWQILYLTDLNRTCPDLPCPTVFADHEWKPVWRIIWIMGPENRSAEIATPTLRVHEAAHSTRGLQQPPPRTARWPPTRLDRPPPHARLLHRLAHLRRARRELCVKDSEASDRATRPPRRSAAQSLRVEAKRLRLMD